MAKHADLTSIHPGAYVAGSDPGAVGANKLWVDTAIGPPYILKVRNAGNTAWAIAANSSTSILWRSAWSGATAYEVGDVVSHEGSAWIAIQAGTNHEPDASPTYWELLAAKGDAGTSGTPGDSIIWRGAWSTGQTWAVLDVVSYASDTYICAVANSSNTSPDLDTTNWDIFVPKGEPGAAGADGADGADGASFAFVPYTLEDESIASRGATVLASSYFAGAQTGQPYANDPYWGQLASPPGPFPPSSLLQRPETVDWRSDPGPSDGGPNLGINGQWVKVDLGSIKSISEFQLHHYTWGLQGWKVQSSTDDTNWTDRFIGQGTADLGMVRMLDAPVTARYWRFYVFQPSSYGTTVQLEHTPGGGWHAVGIQVQLLQFRLYSGDRGTGGVDTSLITLNFMIDGGGSTISTGIKGDLVVDFDCTIRQVTMLADQSGSAVVDIWKDTYANYPPTDADSITASAPPTLTSAVKMQDDTLTGWTTAIAAGSILRFNVDSVTSIQRLTIGLKVQRTAP